MRAQRPIGLIVNGDVAERVVARSVFEACGVEALVEEVTESAVALANSLEDAPVAIFVDLTLTGRPSGAALALLLRVRFPEALLVVTSDRKPDFVSDAHFLLKPWCPDDLASELRRALGEPEAVSERTVTYQES